MKWMIIWICACNPGVEIVYGAQTEANVRAYAEALFNLDTTQGTYMIAHVSDHYLQQEIDRYDNRDSRPETIRIISRRVSAASN